MKFSITDFFSNCDQIRRKLWPNSQETADLVTFTEEIRNGKLHFFRTVGSIINIVTSLLLIFVQINLLLRISLLKSLIMKHCRLLCYCQKQLSIVVLSKRYSEKCRKFTEEHPCWSAVSMKLQSNFIEIKSFDMGVLL